MENEYESGIGFSHTFNSLLRDQLARGLMALRWGCSTFNSLLRDQDMKPFSGFSEIVIGFQFSLARSEARRLHRLGRAAGKLSILSCEIRSGL